MLSRREFVALLGTLPVLRFLPGDRLRCQHRMEPFKRGQAKGPVREWLRGQQCQDCGHLKVEERVTIRWGSLGP